MHLPGISIVCVAALDKASASDAGAAMGGDTLTLHGVQLQMAKGELLGICGEVRLAAFRSLLPAQALTSKPLCITYLLHPSQQLLQPASSLCRFLFSRFPPIFSLLSFLCRLVRLLQRP